VCPWTLFWIVELGTETRGSDDRKVLDRSKRFLGFYTAGCFVPSFPAGTQRARAGTNVIAEVKSEEVIHLRENEDLASIVTKLIPLNRAVPFGDDGFLTRPIKMSER